MSHMTDSPKTTDWTWTKAGGIAWTLWKKIISLINIYKTFNSFSIVCYEKENLQRTRICSLLSIIKHFKLTVQLAGITKACRLWLR